MSDVETTNAMQSIKLYLRFYLRYMKKYDIETFATFPMILLSKKCLSDLSLM